MDLTVTQMALDARASSFGELFQFNLHLAPVMNKRPPVQTQTSSARPGNRHPYRHISHVVFETIPTA